MRDSINKMNHKIAVYLLLLSVAASEATLRAKLWPRHAEDAPEQENKPNQQDGMNNKPKLYPELPQLPPQNVGGFVPPQHQGPTPFVPFGMQMPTGQLGQVDRPRIILPPQPRPMTPADRLQSQNFASGLGKRLLSMVGIDMNGKNETSSPESSTSSSRSSTGNPMEDTMKALQNSTVLTQLNKGIHSIYGGLSKMYNETVQQQLNLLQERLKTETENSTSPWQQRMAQRMPEFFKTMTAKVEEAQARLNKVWQDVSNGSSISRTDSMQPNAQPQTAQRSFFGSVDEFMGNRAGEAGAFFDNLGRTFRFNSDPNSDPNAPKDFGAQVRDFWSNQVQPQIGMVRNQMSRVWRDLTSSGALSPEIVYQARSRNVGASPSNKTSEMVEDILKDVEMNGSEYTLLDGKPESENSNDKDGRQNMGQQTTLNSQMQNGLINAQRELNQLWMGLSNSLQGAIGNVKNALNPRPQFGMNPAASSNRQAEADPAENEIDGKIKDLGKIQRDVDMVFNVVQQQQQENQQRQTFGDRFKNLFNNVDLSGMDQLPNRIGESVSRFGTVVNDLWNQIPNRWDNFMQNVRPQPEFNARLTTSTTTPKPER